MGPRKVSFVISGTLGILSSKGEIGT